MCSRSKGSKKREALQSSTRRPLCLPHTLFPLLWVCPAPTGLPLAGGTRDPWAVTETQRGTCSADDPCSRRSKYSWVAESTAQRSSLQIGAAPCTSQFLRFEKWSCDSSNKHLEKKTKTKTRCFSCLSIRLSVLLVPHRRPQQRPKLPFFRWAGRKEARNAKASASYSPRRGKGPLLHSWSS